MALIEPGKKAPAFTLNDQNGKTHKLSEYAGRPVVFYFYPKDDTPGCTKETCDFRDNLPRFAKSKAAVFGISILDEASKARFAKKYDVTFPLLADEDHAVAENTACGSRSRSTAASSWATCGRRISSAATARSRGAGTT